MHDKLPYLVLFIHEDSGVGGGHRSEGQGGLMNLKVQKEYMYLEVKAALIKWRWKIRWDYNHNI